MSKTLKLIFFILIAIAFGGINVFAVGTPAGTDIVNIATVTYEVGAVTGLTAASDPGTATVTVAEILDIQVTSQDASALQVTPGDTDSVRTFRVTNIGNGTEAVELSALSTLTGDDFNPTSPSIRIDGDGDGLYVPANDPAYVPGTNDPVLDANDTVNNNDWVTVFILNNIPSTGVVEGNTGDTQLTAASITAVNDTNLPAFGSITPGTQITSPTFFEGDGGVEAVVGSSQAYGEAIGTYVISSVEIEVRKSVVITDAFGQGLAIAMPGGTLTYTIEVEVTSGTGTADNVVFTDPLPTNTTFTAGTDLFQLDSGSGLAALTPAADALDGGDVGGTTAGEVTVDLGSLSQADGIQTIIFSVSIN